ncbi:MAG: hypothetical protein U1F53_16150 [Burkholderiaceae bacterium]
MKTRRATTTLLSLLAMAASASSPAAPALRCTLAAPARVVAGEPVVLRFSFSNPGPSPLQVLRWNTPFEGAWLAPFVELTRDGRPVSYQGPMVKRAEPGPDSYLRIEAHSAATAEIELAPAFDVSLPGRYRVQPRLHLADVRVARAGPVERPRAEHVGTDLACPAVSFSVVPKP